MDIDEASDTAEKWLVLVLDEIEAIQISIAGGSLPRWQLQAQLSGIDLFMQEHPHYESLEKRMGERRFLAIGSYGGVVLSIVAGLLIHPAALASAAWKLKRLLYWDRSWRPKVVKLYSTLRGTEGAVFEAIHSLETTAIVVNFDALYVRDYESAYGLVSPRESEIVDQLPEIDPAEVHLALMALSARQIIRSDHERYWIAF